MSKFWIIAKDVYFKTIKTPSFIIGIFLPFIVVLGGIFFANFAKEDQSLQKIGIYTKEPALTQALVAQKQAQVRYRPLSSLKEAKSQLKAEKIDYYLVVEQKGVQLTSTVYGKDIPGNNLKQKLTQTVTNVQLGLKANAYQLTPKQIETLVEPAQLTPKKVDFEADGQVQIKDDTSDIEFMIAYVACIFTFFLVMTYASIIAQEIASEKGMRIMEVILSSTSAKTHFYGKLAGVILATLTQLFLMGLLLVGTKFAFQSDENVKDLFKMVDLDQVSSSYLVFLLLFIIGGCLLYAVLAALCGSLVNRAEDAPKAVAPVSYLLLIAYILGLVMAVNDPNNILVTVTSYLPFFSTFIMPVLLAKGLATTLSAVLSLVILGGSLVVLAVLSAKMYKANVLVYDQRGIWSALKKSVVLLRKGV
ncbi:ABC transporter permease [Ligilactobacillus faecis]|uniref:ABC transporter permease n=1 Tax=Ligilactobacillus faecis TaxID=762833 RepID=A0ABV4DQY5_9LACO